MLHVLPLCENGGAEEASSEEDGEGVRR